MTSQGHNCWKAISRKICCFWWKFQKTTSVYVSKLDFGEMQEHDLVCSQNQTECPHSSTQSYLPPHLTSFSLNCGITVILLLLFIFTSYLSFYLASLILLSSPRPPQLGLLPSPAGREPAVPAPSPRSHPRTQAPGWARRTAAVGLLPQIYSTGRTHTQNYVPMLSVLWFSVLSMQNLLPLIFRGKPDLLY